MLRDWAEPGAVRRMHNHADATYHVFTLLTGQLILTIEGQAPVEVKAGDVVDLKGGVMHTFKNTGTVTATIVEVFRKGAEAVILLRSEVRGTRSGSRRSRFASTPSRKPARTRAADHAQRDVVGEALRLQVRVVRVDPHVAELVGNRGLDFFRAERSMKLAIDA